ncbi:hypothetical protein WME89_13430 [Sorangium sp. So ce321]|uniref:hypothetical protein n=1 Tax=Sorangium sp. So ce321 TaxID=3133300 RepID=UPI003F627BA5
MEAITIPERPKNPTPLAARIGMRIVASPFSKVLGTALDRVLGAKEIESDRSAVARTATLTPRALAALFSNRICAIHIPQFVSREACDTLSNNILKQDLVNWNVRDPKKVYKKSDVDTLGVPFNVAARSQEEWTDYFTSAVSGPEVMRALAAPHPFPIDSFRDLINKHWKHGLKLKEYKGHPMRPSLIRVMHDNAEMRERPLNCHADSAPLLSSQQGVFSVNIYLKKPTRGGDLYIWNPRLSLVRHWSLISNFFLAPSYMDEELQTYVQGLLPPPIRLSIEAGDLVMLNTGRPHAVTTMQGGPRVSIQAFLKYKRQSPVLMWA